MKEHKYYLAYSGDDLAASFDAYEDNKQLKVLLSVCKAEGYTVKDVSKSEYEKQKEIEEEKELKRIGYLLNDQ